jgi:hypothetical protein
MIKKVITIGVIVAFLTISLSGVTGFELNYDKKNNYTIYFQNKEDPIEKNYTFAAFGLNDNASIEASYRSYVFGTPRTVDGRTVRYLLIFDFEATMLEGSAFVYGFVPLKYNVTPRFQEYYISQGDTIRMGFIYTALFIDSWILLPEGTTIISDSEDFHFLGMSIFRGGIFLHDYPPYYNP